MPIIIPYTTEEEWLNHRLDDITSTDVSALFGLSPYTTEYEVFYNKKNRINPDFAETDRMKWGKRFEDVIAQGVAQDLGLTVEPLKVYMRHSTVKGMGSSFDYAIVGHQDGPGLMEIKNVDARIYRDKWSDSEAPAHIETQVQHQMEVADAAWCLIVAMSGGNDPRVIRRERDRDIGKALCKRVSKFWRDVESDNIPTPDYIKDAEFIIGLHRSAGVNLLEVDTESAVYKLLVDYEHLSAEARSYEALTKAKKAEILDVIGDDYNKVKGGEFTLSCGTTKDTPPTIITPEMVGTEIGGRKGYRMCKLAKRGGLNDLLR